VSSARLGGLGAQCRHPDFAIVKTVNSRRWCAAFNRESGTGVPGSRFCETREDFNRAIEALEGSFPLVAKPAFGGSGHGFVKIAGADTLTAALFHRLDGMILHSGFTLEPWCERLHDISTSCTIGDNGEIRNLRHYRCHINSHGAFFGVSLGVSDPIIGSYEGDLERAARTAAAALAAEGYFGPVSFDSFVYRDAPSGASRLAPAIEVNARYVMSSIAHALYENIGPGRCCLFKLVGRKKISLPESYGELQRILGKNLYDPRQKLGILPISPLRVKHARAWTQPARSAFLISAKTPEELQVMETYSK
jgi:hypothetical protein